MVSSGNDYYDGFRTFTWLADIVGLPIDQVNFLITQFTALILAGLLRSSLSVKRADPVVRHAFGLVVGLALGYFCFGRQAVHIAVLPTLCYLVMRTLDPRCMHRFVLVVALGYLSCIHIHRQIYDYGSYTLDITGPLMVITQKVTSLAFSVHDGLTRKDEDLPILQRHQAVHQMPTALEYFSYVFHFQALMAGPIIFYRDYNDFIHGRYLEGVDRSTGKLDNNVNNIHTTENGKLELPSPELIVIKKVAASLACAVFFVILIPTFPIRRIKEDDFLKNTTIFYKAWYLIVSTMCVRFKYYHAWLFADAICNNSGFGFNGYNEKGEPRWDLVSNVDAVKFEVADSLKESIDQWNKGTNRWLRSVAYERAGRNKMIATYSLSALWHGFYPGYYLTFANGAFFTLASRTVRRHIRPHFLGSERKKMFYDLLTFVTTKVVMAYLTFTFVLLEFVPSIKLYLHLYLLPHICGLAVIFLLPYISRTLLKKTSAKDSPSSVDGGIDNRDARKAT